MIIRPANEICTGDGGRNSPHSHHSWSNDVSSSSSGSGASTSSSSSSSSTSSPHNHDPRRNGRAAAAVVVAASRKWRKKRQQQQQQQQHYRPPNLLSCHCGGGYIIAKIFYVSVLLSSVFQLMIYQGQWWGRPQSAAGGGGGEGGQQDDESLVIQSVLRQALNFATITATTVPTGNNNNNGTTTTTNTRGMSEIVSTGAYNENRRGSQNSNNANISKTRTNRFAAVFYNIYVPTREGLNRRNETHLGCAHRVVREQINQVGASVKRGANLRQQEEGGAQQPFTVYYNTIGRKDGLNESFMEELCTAQNRIHCQHMAHYVNGFEEVTLQRLYEYCLFHPTHRVAYVHSKGCYHPSDDNEIFRPYMTAAALHPDCQNPPDDACNVCGLSFHPIWMPMFPGNIWTAQCSYVRKLHAPAGDFPEASRRALVGALPENTMNFTKHMFLLEDWTAGLDRFAQEAWIASHPSVVPCDVSTKASLPFWTSPGRDTTKHFRWSLAPRHSLYNETWWILNKQAMRKNVLNDRYVRMQEYFLLAGKIHKWLRLYNEIPPPSSWVWKWFPDGIKWQRHYRMHGRRTVKVVLAAAQARTPVP